MATATSPEPGIVEYFGTSGGHSCGYCGNSNTNHSHGMWSHSLTVQDYQDLIDRGWRRSGKYCYKPTMNKTCCPHYTIKCEALNFTLNKSHKKIMKQVNKFLIHGIKKGESNVKEKNTSETSSKKQNTPETSDKSEEKQEKPDDCPEPQAKKKPTQGAGPDPNKPPMRKAKEIRMERKLSKQSLQAVNPDGTPASLQHRESTLSTDSTMSSQSIKSMKNEPKSLEDFLNEPALAENCAHKLEIKLVRSSPRSKEFQQSFKESHQVYHKYQMGIHHDPPHKPNEGQYTRFLVDSPLQEEHRQGGLTMGYGSFHQHYILDGKIIAVGVIDILPTCVSSVYLYYHPDYDFLSLGTYTALREIAFVRELNKMAPDLIHYYMGYYIHSCPKMRYKGQYYPSFLLCPETYNWFPISVAAPKLDVNKYSRFAEEGVEDEGAKLEINKVMILFSRQAMTYDIYRAFNSKSKDQKEVMEYAYFVGKKCAERLLLFRK